MSKKEKKNMIYYQVKRGLGIDELSDEDAGIIFKALDRYDGTSREDMPNVATRILYKNYCDHIDFQLKSYDEFCEKQRERVNKRWNRDTMVYHGIPPNTTEYHGIPPNTTEYHGIPPNTTEYHGIPAYTIYNNNNNNNNNNNIEAAANACAHTCVREERFSSPSEYQEYFLNNLKANERWVNDTSELIMYPTEDIIVEIDKFKLQLRCTEDQDTDDCNLRVRLIAWLKKSKRESYNSPKQNTNGSNNSNNPVLEQIRKELDAVGIKP